MVTWHMSHLSPVTPVLHEHLPSREHWRSTEPVRKEELVNYYTVTRILHITVELL